MPERSRVVVVGGGFGGLNVTRALDGADVDVTVVDRTNHYLFSRCSTRSPPASCRPA
jgi:NADH dehydrogenase FAD-containing subunit